MRLYKGKKVIHIVAMGANCEIGLDNRLLWHIPEELKLFSRLTIGKVVLMGRKTIDSLPKFLNDRKLVKASREKGLTDEESIDNALDKCVLWADILGLDKIIVAGGAEIYKSTEKYIDEIYMTVVKNEYPNADTFYNLPEKQFSGSELIMEHELFLTHRLY